MTYFDFILEKNYIEEKIYAYKHSPFLVVYKSKPIKGIVLELVTINSNYEGEKDEIR